MHWNKWDVMTYSKKEGEFRFRELHTFNSTLLANMASRVFNELNAVWVQVLKGIFYEFHAG